MLDVLPESADDAFVPSDRQDQSFRGSPCQCQSCCTAVRLVWPLLAGRHRYAHAPAEPPLILFASDWKWSVWFSMPCVRGLSSHARDTVRAPVRRLLPLLSAYSPATSEIACRHYLAVGATNTQCKNSFIRTAVRPVTTACFNKRLLKL